MWCGQKDSWITQDVSVAYVVQYEVADELEKKFEGSGRDPFQDTFFCLVGLMKTTKKYQSR
jgi:hypothetical protein